MKILKGLSIAFVVIGSISLLAMLAFINVDVIARMVFNDPVAGSTELISFLLVISNFLFLAATQFYKRNIVITIIIDMFKKRTRRVIDAVIFLSCALFSILICWETFVQGISDLKGSVISSVMEIPFPPFKFVAAAGCGLLSVVFLADFINCFRRKD
jgi:TRAP-type C4-dicarboxylate transport system permease small subunit